MHLPNPMIVASAVALAAVFATLDAHALGPVDIEVAAKGGYATNPSSTGAPNPLGFGLGGRVGLAFKGGMYLGGSVVDYFTGSETNVLAGTSATTSTPSINVLMYGAELGYGLKLVDPLTLRPQVGFGDANLTVSGQSGNETYWYLEPGVVGLVQLGVLFVGADVNMLLIPTLPGTQRAQAAFTFHAQVGVKF